MTSRNCSDYHPVLGLFGATLKRQIGISLLVTGFLCLICPGLLWRELAESYSDSIRLNRDISAWATVIFLASLTLGAILLCFNHGHFFSRQTADLYYALPIKRDSLLALRFGAAFVGAVFAMTVSFSGLTIINFLPGVRGVAPGEMLKLYGLLLLMLFLCLNTVQVFVVYSGSIFHLLFSMMVVCVGIPVLFFLGCTWYENAARGVQSSYDWLRYTSPFAYGVSGFAVKDGELLANGTTVLVASVQSLLLMAVSFLKNHRRKAENSGSSFAFRSMPVLITLIAAALGGCLVAAIFTGSGGEDIDFWLFFTVGATMVAVASGAISAKGFRKIWRWFVCAGAATALTLTMFLTATAMGNHATYVVPNVEDVASVTIYGNYQSPTVTVKENIELVTKLHSHMVKMHTGAWEDDYSIVTIEEDGTYVEIDRYSCYSQVISQNFDIRYEMKNGSVIERNYYVSDYEGMCLLLDIMRTDEYAEAWANDLNTQGCDVVHLDYYDRQNDRYDAAVLSVEESRELLEIYARELQELTVAQLIDNEEWKVNVDLMANNSLQLIIPNNGFEETMAWVEAHLN